MCPHTTLECVLLEIRLHRPHNKRTCSSTPSLLPVEGHPTVRYARVLLPYNNSPILNTTWTGDTHVETDVLPSSE